MSFSMLQMHSINIILETIEPPYLPNAIIQDQTYNAVYLYKPGN